MMKALISIDYTNDFVATDGKLTTGAAGQAIESELVALTKDFLAAGEYVVLRLMPTTLLTNIIQRTNCFRLTM